MWYSHTFWGLLDTGQVELILPSWVGALGNQVVNGVLAQVHLVVGPLSAQAHPMVIAWIPGCMMGMNIPSGIEADSLGCLKVRPTLVRLKLQKFLWGPTKARLQVDHVLASFFSCHILPPSLPFSRKLSIQSMHLNSVSGLAFKGTWPKVCTSSTGFPSLCLCCCKSLNSFKLPQLSVLGSWQVCWGVFFLMNCWWIFIKCFY